MFIEAAVRKDEKDKKDRKDEAWRRGAKVRTGVMLGAGVGCC